MFTLIFINIKIIQKNNLHKWPWDKRSVSKLYLGAMVSSLGLVATEI